MGKTSRTNHGWAQASQLQGTLEQDWKAWIAQDAFSARRAAATRAKAAAAQIPEYDA